jgi:hypothetical protein
MCHFKATIRLGDQKLLQPVYAVGGERCDLG